MPLVCIACAVDLIRDSETLQPYAFQSLKPICGVSASPLPSAAAGCAVPTETRGTPRQSSATEKANPSVLRRDRRGNGGKTRSTLAMIMLMSLTPVQVGQHAPPFGAHPPIRGVQGSGADLTAALRAARRGA